MDRKPTEAEIREFIESAGLDKDLLDDPSEALEGWQQECNRLVKGFFGYIEDRLSVIERRLNRLEQLVGGRNGYQQEDGTCR